MKLRKLTKLKSEWVLLRTTGLRSLHSYCPQSCLSLLVGRHEHKDQVKQATKILKFVHSLAGRHHISILTSRCTCSHLNTTNIKTGSPKMWDFHILCLQEPPGSCDQASPCGQEGLQAPLEIRMRALQT